MPGPVTSAPLVPGGGSERARWNEKHASAKHRDAVPSPFLVQHERILPRAGRALVLGCGDGCNIPVLARNLEVIAIDISDVAVDLARDLVASHCPSHEVRLVRGDVNELLPVLEPSLFDVITSINFFEPGIVREMRRLLKPGGTLLVQAYTMNDERMQASPVRDKLVDPEAFFSWLPGYWFVVHEVERFIDGSGSRRERVNLVARKPL